MAMRYDIKFGMMQVREKEVSLRKWSGGISRALEGTLLSVKPQSVQYIPPTLL